MTLRITTFSRRGRARATNQIVHSMEGTRRIPQRRRLHSSFSIQQWFNSATIDLGWNSTRLHSRACSVLDNFLRGGPLRLPSLHSNGAELLICGFTIHLDLISVDALSSKQSAIHLPNTGRNLKALETARQHHARSNTSRVLTVQHHHMPGRAH